VLTYNLHASDSERQSSGLEDLHFLDVPISERVRSAPGQLGIYLRYLAWQRAAYRRARELLRDHRFDVVHHLTWGSLVWGSPLWRLDLPFVFGPAGGGQVTPRGYGRYFGTQRLRESGRSWVIRRILPMNPLTRRTLKGAHMVFAQNSDTLRIVERLASRSYLSTGAAIPPEYMDGVEARMPKPGEVLRIVWVARLYPRKGLRLALEALSSIRDVSWHLTIVGDGPLGPLLPGWINELQIQDQVRWTGQIGWQDVRAEYQKAHVFLFTSLRETLGVQLYEALGSGLPVIALNLHGARDMLPEDAAVKVDVGTPSETLRGLSAAIRALAVNPKRVHAMSQAALRFAAQNGWEAQVQSAYGLIEESLQMG
jgi:glycosyltransferase involved in cell wall biosynthesis